MTGASSRTVKVFILADNRLLREALTRVMRKRGDIRVVGAAPHSAKDKEGIDASGCDVLLLDAVATGQTDLDLVREVVHSSPAVKVILIGMEDDETAFLNAVRAGAVGYTLQDASALDVVNAVRAVAQDEAACPPRLCRSLLEYVSREWNGVPNARIKTQLGLTRREQQLVPFIARGLSNKDIATQLNLSEQTVKNHIHRMLRKTGANDRLAVVERVRVQGACV